jgi:hypothetical protein
MAEFLSNYGLWILLAGIFFAMHAFGMGCCGGGHRHAGGHRTQPVGSTPTPDEAGASKGEEPARRRAGGCH